MYIYACIYIYKFIVLDKFVRHELMSSGLLRVVA